MNLFSQPVSIIHEKVTTEPSVILAGYAALINAYNLPLPLPSLLCAIGHKHHKYQRDGWRMFTPRHEPEHSVYGHLIFALKNEGINLLVLKMLFDLIPENEIVDIINSEPTGKYARRIWFLYEWLQEKKLVINDAEKGNFIPVVDTELQYGSTPIVSKRHRVLNNLPGVINFCPMIRRTPLLDQYISMNFTEKTHSLLNQTSKNILLRTAAFLLLKDSKASFAIEGETPAQDRAERWGKAIGQAGVNELSHDEFLRLQELVIGDFRFVHYGYRNEGGFVGEHERDTGYPKPDHISARPQDIYVLMDGLNETNKMLRKSNYDAALAATLIAFGFIYIHPFADGNGRIHRYLIHHLLAEKKFMADNIIFPISSAILAHIDEYRKVLESCSKPLLSYIKWRPTEKNNVEVLNETINFYRYSDLTQHAEFVYQCIQETIEKILPEEISYLAKYDEMKIFIKNYLNMPDQMIDLLIRFLNQNKGTFSKRALRKEFQALKPDEIIVLENKYSDIFQE